MNPQVKQKEIALLYEMLQSRLASDSGKVLGRDLTGLYTFSLLLAQHVLRGRHPKEI